MIVLRSDRVLVRLDPAHGGEILDLVDLDTGRQLLGRPPFASERPLGGDLDEATWTARYRGGWQIVFPNAGNACEVEGDQHGFHGRASNDPWRVVEAGEAAATLVWDGHWLSAERRLEMRADTVRVETEVRGVGRRAPFVALEHVAAGLELIDPEAELQLLPGAEAYELNEVDGPARAPAFAHAWPEVGLQAGGAERADRWRLADDRLRLFTVTGLDGRARVRNARSGQALELRWDARFMPHVWIWHDVRGTGGIWRHRNEMLAVEPTTVPHSLGLRRAIGEGQATWLEPGQRISWWIEARVAA